MMHGLSNLTLIPIHLFRLFMKKIKHTRNRRKILDEIGVYVQNQSLKAELLQTQDAKRTIK